MASAEERPKSSPEQRLDKAGAEFKRLEAEITELRKDNKELDRKFEFVKTQLAKKHKDMIEMFTWYLDRLVAQTMRMEAGNDIDSTDGLTKSK